MPRSTEQTDHVLITHTDLRYNAALSGGALNTISTDLVVHNSTFKGNVATDEDYEGGAVCVVPVRECKIECLPSYSVGPGALQVCAQLSNAVMSECLFDSNKAYMLGGALTGECSNVTLNNTRIINQVGGAIYFQGRAARLEAERSSRKRERAIVKRHRQIGARVHTHIHAHQTELPKSRARTRHDGVGRRRTHRPHTVNLPAQYSGGCSSYQSRLTMRNTALVNNTSPSVIADIDVFANIGCYGGTLDIDAASKFAGDSLDTITNASIPWILCDSACPSPHCGPHGEP